MNENREELALKLQMLPLDKVQRRMVSAALERLSDEQANAILTDANLIWELVPKLALNASEHIDRLRIKARDRQRQTKKKDTFARELHEAVVALDMVRRAAQLEDTEFAFKLDGGTATLIKVLQVVEVMPQETAWHLWTLLGGFAQRAATLLRSDISPDERRCLVLSTCRCLVAINIIGRKIGGKSFRAQAGNIAQCLPIAEGYGLFRQKRALLEEVLTDEVVISARAIPASPTDLIQRIREEEPDLTDDDVFNAVLNSGDILRVYIRLNNREMNVSGLLNEFSNRCEEYYAAALRIAGDVPSRKLLALERSARNTISTAKILYLHYGRSELDRAHAQISSSINMLESVRDIDFGYLTADEIIRAKAALEILKISALFALLEIDDSRDDIVREASDRLCKLILTAKASVRINPAARMLVHLYKNIVQQSQRGREVAEVAANQADLAGNVRAKAVFEVALLKFGSAELETSEPGPNVLAALLELGRRPTSYDDLDVFLNGYVRLYIGAGSIDWRLALRDFDSPAAAGCSLLHACIFAILAGDGYIEVDNNWPAPQRAFYETLVGGKDYFEWTSAEGGNPKQFAFVVELSSKFYLRRFKMFGDAVDGDRCTRLLKCGLTGRDDNYWTARLASIYLRLGKISLAEELINNCLVREPGDQVALFLKAKICRFEGKLDECRAILRSIVQLSGGDYVGAAPAVISALAHSSSEGGAFGESEKLFRSLLQHNPADVRAAFGLGQVLLKQGDTRYADAIEVFLCCIAQYSGEDDPQSDSVSWRAARCCAATLRAAEENGAVDPQLINVLLAIAPHLGNEALALLLKAFEIIGGSETLAFNSLRQLVDDRESIVLRRRFAQACMARLVHSVITKGTAFSENDLDNIRWCEENSVIGDLLGGAKGAFARAFLQFETMPFVYRRFQKRLAISEARWKRDDVFLELVELLSSIERSSDYYRDVYGLIKRSRWSSAESVVHGLPHLILAIAERLNAQWNGDSERLIRVPVANSYWEAPATEEYEERQGTAMMWVDIDILKFAKMKYGLMGPVLIGDDEITWRAETIPSRSAHQVLALAGIHFQSGSPGTDMIGGRCSIAMMPSWDDDRI